MDVCRLDTEHPVLNATDAGGLNESHCLKSTSPTEQKTTMSIADLLVKDIETKANAFGKGSFFSPMITF